MMMTVAEQIRVLQQYAPDDTVCDPVTEVRGPGNDGTTIPLLVWLQPGETFEVGDRVRKPGYRDTGTVATAQRRAHSEDLVRVIWDATGTSWEPTSDLGRATAAVLR